MIAPAEFTAALLEWFEKNGRPLLWRRTTDPYEIWVSEIMLQQTQVPRVEQDFYPQFLQKFPDVSSLARAKWEEVFPVWKGLGYYSRGKNMLAAARMVQKKWKGAFPQDWKLLQTLPGIGEYTATAILSFAWNERVPAIDTNIEKIIRVLWPKQEVKKMAEELISYALSGRAWNNAMMDLAGELRARNEIPGTLGNFFPKEIRAQFQAARKTRSETKSGAKKERRNHRIEVGIACIHENGKYLIQTRPSGKSFMGQWEFPGGKRLRGEDFRACVKREILEELGIEVSVRPHFFEEIHTFKSTDLLLRFHRCQIQKGIPQPLEGQTLNWVEPARFDEIDFLETNSRALEKLKKMRK